MALRYRWFFVWMALFATPASADPAEWLDRCLTQAEINENNPERIKFDVGQDECVSSILTHCGFVDDPLACYETLITEFNVRTIQLESTLPKSLNGTRATQREKRFYSETREFIEFPRKEEACPWPDRLVECSANFAALEFNLARALTARSKRAFEVKP